MRAAWLVLAAIGCGTEDATTPTGALTEDAFVEAFGERWCAEVVACGGDACAGTGSSTSSSTPIGTSADDCVFRPVPAQACLDGEWVCSPEVAGISFPIPPEPCGDAYTCPDTGT